MRLSNGEVLLAWPLAQHIITQGWFYNDGSMHRAIDLRTQIGNTSTQPVYAAEDGTVDQVQDWDGHTKTGMQSYGNMVRIRHAPYKGGVLQTRYAHLSGYCVKYGQQVKEGDLIGFSGTTGNVFGAHLHFEVILNGKRTNPLVWLDNDFTTASGQVFTYRPGEHAVQQPEQAASGAQTAQNGTDKLQVSR
jgi:murein DD-endopeptidase MepM/ murein hydrolase activator NlpD